MDCIEVQARSCGQGKIISGWLLDSRAKRTAWINGDRCRTYFYFSVLFVIIWRHNIRFTDLFGYRTQYRGQHLQARNPEIYRNAQKNCHGARSPVSINTIHCFTDGLMWIEGNNHASPTLMRVYICRKLVHKSPSIEGVSGKVSRRNPPDFQFSVLFVYSWSHSFKSLLPMIFPEKRYAEMSMTPRWFRKLHGSDWLSRNLFA